jgi:hypothetical protein
VVDETTNALKVAVWLGADGFEEELSDVVELAELTVCDKYTV